MAARDAARRPVRHHAGRHRRGRRRGGAGAPDRRGRQGCERVAPALSGAWRGHPATRPEIAAAAATDGGLAGALEPLLRAEIAVPRRFGGFAGRVTEDERLLVACRTALTAG
ncbi:hypothetical protein AB0J72_43320 [Dactylosporangium sp. NPDC049742]|uniref:hypothetical protein n=1 Tax=Dactylosporangium sp. NPDC049742 TaxID=3154737 RepID=UPI003430192A